MLTNVLFLQGQLILLRYYLILNISNHTFFQYCFRHVVFFWFEEVQKRGAGVAFSGIIATPFFKKLFEK